MYVTSHPSTLDIQTRKARLQRRCRDPLVDSFLCLRACSIDGCAWPLGHGLWQLYTVHPSVGHTYSALLLRRIFWSARLPHVYCHMIILPRPSRFLALPSPTKLKCARETGKAWNRGYKGTHVICSDEIQVQIAALTTLGIIEVPEHATEMTRSRVETNPLVFTVYIVMYMYIV